MRYRSRSLRKGGAALVVVAAFLATLVITVAPAHAATFTVTNLNDSGPGSFRQAMLDAIASPEVLDTVAFTPGLTGTITLSTPADFVVSGDVTIQGPAAHLLTVDLDKNGRLLTIPHGATVRMSGVTVTGGSAFTGGAIFNEGSLTVARAAFSGSSATTGGAIANVSTGELLVERSLFAANTGGGGSAIHNTNLTRIFNSTFTGNSGSAAVESTHLLIVGGSTFSANAGGEGGAIRSTRSLSLFNSTFVGNLGFGTIWIGGTAPSTISSSTIVHNPAGGIRVEGRVTLRSSIVAHNSFNCGGLGLIDDGGFNLYWPFSLCPGVLADPLVDPAGLADNGGPTFTVALTPESPAVDAIPAPCAFPDQRGVPRPQGVGCDIGAFELEQAASPEELIESVLDEIVVLAASSDPKVADKAEDARDKLQTGLAELGKTPPDGAAALGALEGAAGELEAMVKDGVLEGDGLLDDVAQAARLLATDAIDAAAGGDASTLADANGALAHGDALRDDGRYKDAIAKYKDAYSKAESA